MADLNPAPIRVPDKLLKDKELGNYFKELSFYVFQLGQRTGGGNDFIETNAINIETNVTNIATNVIDIATNAANIDNIDTGWPVVEYTPDDFQGSFLESVQSNSYTTIGNEIIKLSNDVNVTLNLTPNNNERVYVKSTGKGFNVVSSKRIDGHNDIRFNKAYSGYWFSYSLELDTWSIM